MIKKTSLFFLLTLGSGLFAQPPIDENELPKAIMSAFSTLVGALTVVGRHRTQEKERKEFDRCLAKFEKCMTENPGLEGLAKCRQELNRRLNIK